MVGRHGDSGDNGLEEFVDATVDTVSRSRQLMVLSCPSG